MNGLLGEWARLFTVSLAEAGVSLAVVSPGSRSTPLVWALAAHAAIQTESIVDERDAAFYAVGHAKITHRPVLLVCTSGSAAANYFPALVEAHHASTPVVVVTADRPFELMDAGASQTIDQVKLYGDVVRRFVDLGMPDGSDGALRALRRIASQAVAWSVSPNAGPVHLNFRARKPLEPERRAAEGDLAARVTSLLAEPLPRPHAPELRPGAEALTPFADAAARAERPLIVVGPLVPPRRAATSAIVRLAGRLGAALFPEATSGARWGAPSEGIVVADALGTLLGSAPWRAGLRPDLVVQVGTTPVSSGLAALLSEAPRATRFVVTDHDWMDPQNQAEHLVFGDVASSLEALADVAGNSATPDRTAWLAQVTRANDLAWRVIDDALAGCPFGEASALRRVLEMLPDGSLLAVGNSLPVREIDLLGRADGRDIMVWSQRGASGIDGLVAGAVGAATAARRPATLIMGDVSLLHDLGGLAVAARSPVPLRIVVLHNGGGRIFEQLPLGSRDDLPPSALSLWTTPHEYRFEGVAAMFGISYREATTSRSLDEALTPQGAGVSLLEIRVAPDSARLFAADVSARLVAASKGLDP